MNFSKEPNTYVVIVEAPALAASTTEDPVAISSVLDDIVVLPPCAVGIAESTVIPTL